MSWNYRIIRTVHVWEGKEDVSLAIHRCFYEEKEPAPDAIPVKWSAEAAAPLGENLQELKDDFEKMWRACERPWLVISGRNKLRTYKG